FTTTDRLMMLSFFFSSRRRHTRSKRDWSSDVCSSDLVTQHQIIWELRFPRIIGAAIVGAAFSVAGALMQGMTRNPLADSGLLGLNAGAVMMLAISFSFLPGLPFV